ncbi:transmembrane protein 79-like [Patiria miniata]|uniref:MAPEG family protein n=1 Tax=Patiria miniata TaxID=46514 RepID=A0A914B747_PATMI|nr:transmembrane protein 79-like [Patiria miniata]XP_038071854.1 transmembrane protein 79-like [Patiria miniata]XP_038071967.1 transmembrane protein 79-like [Patiria miniata]XP_038072041.1 transmembrane protein 79-like [Patiria miniata]
MANQTTAHLQFRKRVCVSAAFGVSLTYIAWVYAPFAVPSDPNLTDRLVFTLRWLALSILPIFVGIQLVGTIRFANMDTAGVVTTTAYAEGLVRLRQRALQNTLEQTAMHVPLMLILGTYLDSNHLKLVPIIICLFVLGRIMYFIGYLFTGNHINRGFGFVLNMFPNIMVLVYCLYCLAVGGANYGLSSTVA